MSFDRLRMSGRVTSPPPLDARLRGQDEWGKRFAVGVG